MIVEDQMDGHVTDPAAIAPMGIKPQWLICPVVESSSTVIMASPHACDCPLKIEFSFLNGNLMEPAGHGLNLTGVDFQLMEGHGGR
jgi:hypothetical protein